MGGSLNHYGILGMKWGRRKGASKKTLGKARVKKMSNEQLRSKIERINLENKYASLTYAKKSKGRKMIESGLEKHGDKLIGAALATGTAYATKKLFSMYAKNRLGVG